MKKQATLFGFTQKRKPDDTIEPNKKSKVEESTVPTSTITIITSTPIDITQSSPIEIDDDPKPDKTKKIIEKVKSEEKDFPTPDTKKIKSEVDTKADLLSPVTPKAGNWVFGAVRAGPRNPGSKQVPIAKEDCLKGIAFVITGVMESLERDEMEDLIKRYGGFVRASISKKTDYIIVGDTPGESKMKKANELERKIITEDEFLAMLKKHEVAFETNTPDSQKPDSGVVKVKPKIEAIPWSPSHTNTLWTTLYHPKKISDLIGNNAAIQKVVTWLKEWKTSSKPKSCMISGQPGVGKTSSAKLIAQELGYDNIIEMNASDSRNKSSLAILREMTDNQSLNNKKSILIMDEVDGMSSGDRGGIAELIQMIKKSRIPILCICNDRYKPALKSLMNYCLDIKFTHAVKTTLVKRIQQICSKHNMNISETIISALVESLNYDIRSILNHLQMMSYSGQSLTYDEAKRTRGDAVQENLFQITTAFLQNRPKSYKTLQEFYFDDSSLIPLMIQQNYLHYHNRGWNRLKAISKAAEAISFSDTIQVFKDWSLTSEHAFFSCIYPTYYVYGNYEKLFPNDQFYPQFPSVLGKGSTTRKNNTLISAIQKDTILQTSGSKNDILFDYCPLFKNWLMKPLEDNDLTTVISRMKSYHLTKDDLMNICDLMTLGDKLKNVYLDLPAKSKAAFTRAYKKEFKESRNATKKDSDGSGDEEE